MISWSRFTIFSLVSAALAGARASSAQTICSPSVTNNSGTVIVKCGDITVSHGAVAGVTTKEVEHITRYLIASSASGWKATLEALLDKLQAESAEQMRATISQFTSIHTTLLELQEKQAIALDGDVATHERIARIEKGLNAVVLAMLAGDGVGARKEVESTSLFLYRSGTANWLEAFFQIESGGPMYEAGVAYSRAFSFPSSTQAHSIGVRFAAYYGRGSTSGGYGSPTGIILSPVRVLKELYAIEPDVELRISLTKRFQLVGLVGTRFGLQTASNSAAKINTAVFAFGVPITAGVSYRIIPQFAIAVNAGVVLDVRHIDPVLRYTGVGADTSDPIAQFQPEAIGGIYAGFCH